MAEKHRPLGERIAGLDIRSTYRDIREGLGPSFARLTDQDLAAALGFVQNERGREVVWALETYYGSHVRFEHQLRRAWADKTETIDDKIEDRIRNRIACALAVRQFAGAAAPVEEWSQLLVEQPPKLKKRISDVLAWLEDLRATGLTCLRKNVGQPRAPLDSQKKRSRIPSV